MQGFATPFPYLAIDKNIMGVLIKILLEMLLPSLPCVLLVGKLVCYQRLPDMFDKSFRLYSPEANIVVPMINSTPLINNGYISAMRVRKLMKCGHNNLL